MREQGRALPIIENRVQVLIAVGGLLLGAFISLIDRPPDHTYFLLEIRHISIYQMLPAFFGVIGNNLHVFSFILLTAACVHLRRETISSYAQVISLCIWPSKLARDTVLGHWQSFLLGSQTFLFFRTRGAISPGHL